MAINVAELTAQITVTGATQAAAAVEQFGQTVQRSGQESQAAAQGTQSYATAAEHAGQQAQQASSGVANLEKQTQAAGQSAQQSSSHLSALSSGLGDIAKTAAGFTLGQGIIEAPAKLMEFAKSAAEDEQATARLQQTLRNLGGDYDDHLRKVNEAIDQGQKLAFSDDQIRDSFGKLAAATGDTDEALRRLSVAQDLARGANIDLETASKLMGKTSDENTQTLRRLGIVIQDAASAQDTFNAVEQKFGGQAGTYANSAAGSYERLQISLKEIGESVGYLVLPVLAAISRAAVDGVEKVQGIMAAFSSSGPAEALGILGKIPQPLQDAAKAAAIAAAAVLGLTLAWGALQTALEAFNVVALATNPIMLALVGVTAAITLGYELLAKSNDSATESQKRYNQAVQERLKAGETLPAQEDAARGALERTTQAYNAAQDALDAYVKAHVNTTGYILGTDQAYNQLKQNVDDTRKAYDGAVGTLQAVTRAENDETQKAADAARVAKENADAFEARARAATEFGRQFKAGIADAISGLNDARVKTDAFLADLRYSQDTSPTYQATKAVAGAAKDAETAYNQASLARDAFLNKPTQEQTEAKLRVDMLNAEIAARTQLDNQRGAEVAKNDAYLQQLTHERDMTAGYLATLNTRQQYVAGIAAAVDQGNLSQEKANQLLAQYAQSSPEAAAAVAEYTQKTQAQTQAHAAEAEAIGTLVNLIAEPLHGAVQTAITDHDTLRTSVTSFGDQVQTTSDQSAQAVQAQADAFVAAGGTMGGAMDAVVTTAQTTAPQVGDAFSVVPPTVQGYVDTATANLSTVGQGAVAPAGTTGQAIGDALGSALLAAIQGWLDKLGSAISGALSAAQQAAAGLAQGVGGLLGGSQTQQQIEQGFLAAGDTPQMAHLMSAISMAESSGQAGAYNPSGAAGIMQFMPASAAAVGVSNPYDPSQAIPGAIRLRGLQGLGAWQAYTQGTYLRYMSATGDPTRLSYATAGGMPWGPAVGGGGGDGLIGLAGGPDQPAFWSPAMRAVYGPWTGQPSLPIDWGLDDGSGGPYGRGFGMGRGFGGRRPAAPAAADQQQIAPGGVDPMALARIADAATASQQTAAQAAVKAAQDALTAWQDAYAKFGADSDQTAKAYEKYQQAQATAAQKAASEALAAWLASNRQQEQDNQRLSKDYQQLAKDDQQGYADAANGIKSTHAGVTTAMIQGNAAVAAQTRALSNQRLQDARAADAALAQFDTQYNDTLTTNQRAVLDAQRQGYVDTATAAHAAYDDAAKAANTAYTQMTTDARTYTNEQIDLAKLGSDAQRDAYDANVGAAADAQARIDDIRRQAAGATDAAYLQQVQSYIDYWNGIITAATDGNKDLVKQAEEAAKKIQKQYDTVTGPHPGGGYTDAEGTYHPPTTAGPALPPGTAAGATATGGTVGETGAGISGMLVRGPDGELRPLVWLTPGQGPGVYRPPVPTLPGAGSSTGTTTATPTPAQPITLVLNLNGKRFAQAILPDLSEAQGRQVELGGF